MAFNKGEWTEAYTFIKLLGEGKVFAADEDLNKVEERAYTIFKIFQDDIRRYYEIDFNNQKINIIDFDDNLIDSKDSADFLEKADESLEIIKNSTGSSFEIQELDEFLNSIGIYKLKGSSNKKEDIKMEILDLNLNDSKELNFSIKSFLGENPTLFNASKENTNFLFKVEGLSDDDMDDLNNNFTRIQRFGKIFEEYQNQNYKIEFIEKEKDNDKILFHNLRLIDEGLPKSLAFMLFVFFSHRGVSSVLDLTKYLIEFNPLGLDDFKKDAFYNEIIGEFIEAVFFGMKPATKWDGNNEINGGLLSVLKDGDILCHHISYDSISLKNYLINHTKFEYPSSNTHHYGKVFKENGEFFFKLNLQVRFK